MTVLTVAQERFRAMKSHVDFAPVIRFAVEGGFAPDERSAERVLDGVLQWLVGHASAEHAQTPYVMMNGDVDEMFHALILNTRIYLQLCREHIGFYIHHTPLDAEEAEGVEEGIGYTIDYILDTFGDLVSPSILHWKEQFDRGELTASSVSCMGNGYEPAVKELLDIDDFRTFWDRNVIEGTA
ncbi:hypothetical protein CL652_00550 [bacterium]|nr:hypothetical protein [bacterium]|tara:strand:+ start:12582 stop:13130 length:549 start_codon:yes stop_codon:yes gene_type:complete